jgi:UDP-N-acetylmuramoyl-L-alanyl-D-glutamate--2,6-diaminopimelate ligase
MGAAAAAYADRVVVTDDNPRSEAPADIRAAVLRGAVAQDRTAGRSPGRIIEIGDRGAAIRAAVAQAGPEDTVVVLGKGHESGQEIAGVVHPFDDRAELRSALIEHAAADSNRGEAR